jgi:hypothetical protein
VIKESSAALALNPRYMKALKRRSRAYEETEKYAECLEGAWRLSPYSRPLAYTRAHTRAQTSR